ncbi:MAG: hypothetical protein ACJ76S_05675 [Solirubrobacteraceae bacterium]|jgi:hypothetical protein
MATLIDVNVLWKLVIYSLAGGIGVTLAFSIAIYGAIRFVDLRRDGHSIFAGAFAALAAVALASVAAGVVYAVSILAHKS